MSPSSPPRPVAQALRVPLTAALAAAALVMSACGSSSSGDDAEAAKSSAPPKPVVQITPNVAANAKNVPVDKVVSVKVGKGRIDEVKLTGAKGSVVRGTVAGGGVAWNATDVLEPGSTYSLSVTATGTDGKKETTQTAFSTQPLGLDKQTYPSIAPLNGETVGVGMPVIVTFDVPVTDHAAFEKKMSVKTQPAQVGSWYWVSDKEVHYRPKTYWKPHSTVTVNLNINSVPAGGGVYGQKNRSITFHTGDSHIYRVNAKTDQMQVLVNGRTVRTIPVTTGKPGFTTRSGVKIIIEKYARKDMNSETIGIGKQNQEYYDMKGVKWAMRMTFSGEFIHGAPWSVADQGHDNVSHGCTGVSDENAHWLYNMTRRGDVVETVGTDRQMEFGNGWGDWNLPFDQYKSHSALS